MTPSDRSVVDELLGSVREAGEILRGERPPSRRFTIEDAHKRANSEKTNRRKLSSQPKLAIQAIHHP